MRTRTDRRAAVTALMLVTLVSMWSRGARADDAGGATAGDPKARAAALFKEAKELVKAGKPELACPKFEESERLDPGAGTQFNLADCEERLGKFATAYRLFADLETVLRKVDDNDRAAKAHERSQALEGRIPTLTIDLPWSATAEALVVQLDDAAVVVADLGKALPLDPGVHHLAVRAEKKKPFARDIALAVGSHETVHVPAEDAQRGFAPPKNDASTSAGRGQRTAALVVGGVGAAALGTGIVLGVVANGQFKDAVAGCHDEGGTAHCPAGSGATGKADSARSLATVGTIVGGVGAAAIVGAVVLWLTAPRGAPAADAAHLRLRVTPRIGTRGGDVLVGATF